MDEITKTGNTALKEDRPVYVVVCHQCKDAFRTNNRGEFLCGDCYYQIMDEAWLGGDSDYDY